MGENSENTKISSCQGFTLTVGEDGAKKFTCKSCANSFNTRQQIYQHTTQVHHNLRAKLRKCTLCDVKVPGYARAFHLEECHGKPAPSCGACGKKFAYPFQVLRHQKYDHLGESEYRCEPCNLKFENRSRYNNHLVKHGDVKAFRCELCDKTFKWERSLSTHLLIHKDVRRHVCHICRDAFVQHSSLRYHMIKKHPEAT